MHEQPLLEFCVPKKQCDVWTTTAIPGSPRTRHDSRDLGTRRRGHYFGATTATHYSYISVPCATTNPNLSPHAPILGATLPLHMVWVAPPPPPHSRMVAPRGKIQDRAHTHARARARTHTHTHKQTHTHIHTHTQETNQRRARDELETNQRRARDELETS